MAFTIIKGVGTYPLSSSKTEDGETGQGTCELHSEKGSSLFMAMLGGDVDERYYRGTWVCVRCFEIFENSRQGRLW